MLPLLLFVPGNLLLGAYTGDDDDKVGGTKVVHFTYEGAKGPEFWCTPDPTVATCSSGTSQSPVLPTNQTTFRYSGSLTTSPCTKGVV